MRRNGYAAGNGLFSPGASRRYRRARHPAAAGELHAGRARGRSRVRGGPSGERLRAGGCSRGACRPGVSLLRLGDQEADALRFGESGADVRGGRHVAEPRGEVAGVSHRLGALQRVRRGLARVLPDAAAADDDRHERAPGAGLSRRGRPDRHHAERGGSRGTVERPAAPGELFRGGGGGRLRLSRPASSPATSRLAFRREARIDPNFPFYGSDIKLQTRYILENLAQHLRGGRHLARSRRQGAGVPHRPQRFLRRSTRSGASISRRCRRARRSGRPGSWSRTRWSRST